MSFVGLMSKDTSRAPYKLKRSRSKVEVGHTAPRVWIYNAGVSGFDGVRP